MPHREIFTPICTKFFREDWVTQASAPGTVVGGFRGAVFCSSRFLLPNPPFPPFEAGVTSYQQRQQRVNSGSRRQRDLAVTSFDYGAFVAQHFPNEIASLARAATWQVHARHHKRKDPEPAEVQKRLEEMGWTRARMEATP